MKKRLEKITFLIVYFLCLNSSGFSQNISGNKQVVTRYFEEVVNKQRIELLREIYSDDYFFHSLEDGSEAKGIKGLEDFLPYFFKAFPDIHYTIDQIIAEGDKVVVQVTVTGTHKGEFWGHQPSNNKIKISEVFFLHLEG